MQPKREPAAQSAPGPSRCSLACTLCSDPHPLPHGSDSHVARHKAGAILQRAHGRIPARDRRSREGEIGDWGLKGRCRPELLRVFVGRSLAPRHCAGKCCRNAFSKMHYAAVALEPLCSSCRPLADGSFRSVHVVWAMWVGKAGVNEASCRFRSPQPGSIWISAAVVSAERRPASPGASVSWRWRFRASC